VCVFPGGKKVEHNQELMQHHIMPGRLRTLIGLGALARQLQYSRIVKYREQLPKKPELKFVKVIYLSTPVSMHDSAGLHACPQPFTRYAVSCSSLGLSGAPERCHRPSGSPLATAVCVWGGGA